MTQLVGCNCAICHKGIPSIVAGEFCRACGNPIHMACKQPSPDDGKHCVQCGADMDTPVASAFRAERRKAMERAKPTSVSQTYPFSRQLLKFSVRLLIGGVVCMFIGVWFFVDGLTEGMLEDILGGLVWKGSLLFLAGGGAAFYGLRTLVRMRYTQTTEKKSSPDAGTGSRVEPV